jgi:hypothetical protein
VTPEDVNSFLLSNEARGYVVKFNDTWQWQARMRCKHIYVFARQSSLLRTRPWRTKKHTSLSDLHTQEEQSFNVSQFAFFFCFQYDVNQALKYDCAQFLSYFSDAKSKLYNNGPGVKAALPAAADDRKVDINAF